MCGIFGSIGNNSTKEMGMKACAAMKHRGPDDSGVLEFGQGVFAHTRLSILDLSSAGKQPMQSQDGRISLVYNGEIYNYKELREELAHSYSFQTNTDTEVLIAAYLTWGEKCLDRLRGMFAFGLWDENEQKLFCAVDRFSIKPLYYWREKDRFLFSSEIKPMLAAGVKPEPCRQAMYDFLAFGFLDHGSETFFEGVYQLRPAQYLILKDGNMKIGQYWDLQESPSEQGTEEEVTKKLSEKLEEVMRYHLVSDVEVALSLSSGVDSNYLRGVLESFGEKFKGFTYAFTDTVYDESEPLRGIIDSKKCDWYITDIKPKDFFSQYSEFIHTMEEPASGLGMYGYWLNAKTVHNKGVKVLLDGQGADEIFGGYKHYYYHRMADLWEQKRFEELKKEVEIFNQVHGESIQFPADDFGEFLKRNTSLSSMRAADGTGMAGNFMGADFAESFATREITSERKFEESLRNAMYYDLFSFKIPKLLRFQDKAAMAWSVESRVPFLDHTLVEYTFSLPSQYLVKNGTGKHLFRRIAEQYAKTPIGDAPKLYMNTPQREWIKGDLRSEIQEMIEASALAKEGYVDSNRLKQEFNNYLSQEELGNSFFAWKFFSLELWYRDFIKNSL